MLGLSKKRFFITLGLSVGIWLVSGFIQALIGFSDYFSIFHKCSLAGYPIALCISSNSQAKIVLTSFVNIIFWFWVIHLFWSWFNKSRN